jgi:hypothetical protein
MGYTPGHYPVKVNPPAPGLTISLKRGSDESRYVAGVFTSIRVDEDGLAMPVLVPFGPNRQCALSQIVATTHRFACKMPAYNGDEMSLFTEYYREFIVLAFTPLRDDEVPGFKQWLDSTSYSGARKKALLKLRESITGHDVMHLRVKSFIKDEFYSEPKNPRAINSYTDESKTLLGALFHAIDKKTFATRFFVKGSNPRDWPNRLEDLFGNQPVLTTDFSSFEAHHQGALARVPYFWALHMMRHLTRVRSLRDLVAAMMLGVNDIAFSRVNVACVQRLMSGAMWTSSANGVLNLCLMSYMSARVACPGQSGKAMAAWSASQFRGLVEGDDGICLDLGIPQSLPDRLGLKLKWEKSPDYSTAGFCSIYCDRDSRIVIKNPIEALQKLFVLSNQYQHFRETAQKTILRAKAMSYLTAFGACPVLASACHFILRRTAGYDVRGVRGVLDARLRTQLDEALSDAGWRSRKMVPLTSRLLVERIFGLSVSEQLAMESAFDNAVSDTVVMTLAPRVPAIVLQHALNFMTREPAAWAPPAHVLPDSKVVEAMFGPDQRWGSDVDRKHQSKYRGHASRLRSRPPILEEEFRLA